MIYLDTCILSRMSSLKRLLPLLGIICAVFMMWMAAIHALPLCMFCVGLQVYIFKGVEWSNTAHVPAYINTAVVIGIYELVCYSKVVFGTYALAVPIYFFTGVLLSLQLQTRQTELNDEHS